MVEVMKVWNWLCLAWTVPRFANSRPKNSLMPIFLFISWSVFHSRSFWFILLWRKEWDSEISLEKVKSRNRWNFFLWLGYISTTKVSKDVSKLYNAIEEIKKKGLWWKVLVSNSLTGFIALLNNCTIPLDSRLLIS